MRLFLVAFVAVTALAVSCSSSTGTAVELPDPQFEFTDEQLAELSEQALRLHAIEQLSDEELDARIERVQRERAERLEKAQVIVEEVMASWEQEPCPANGPITEAFFDPPGEVALEDLDLEPHESWSGYEIVHVANLVLPAGFLLESGGEYMGDEGTPIPVAERGTYPYFMAMSRYREHEWLEPAVAQLVLDPTSPPVRWEDDQRFGFGTGAGSGWIGSPEALPVAKPDPDDAVRWEAWILVDQLMFEVFIDEPVCTTWARDDGANFVVYSNGFGDGYFPGAAGYDKDDRLVAITWFFGHGSWVLAGIPGAPPQPVQDQIDCRRAALADGADASDC